MTTTRPIFPSQNPEILTPRLLLRPMQESDFPEFRRLRTSPEVMIWTRSKRTDPDEAFTRERMRIFLTPNEGKTFAYGAFEREAPDRLVGLTGCHQSEPVPECGYMFFPEYWGKGYATEALRAWLAAYWALERREAAMVEEDKERGDGVEVLMATTDVTNVGSQGVLRKCGFVETKKFDMEGTVPFIEFVLPRPT